MNESPIAFTLPADVVDAIVEQVAERVLTVLAAQERSGGSSQLASPYLTVTEAAVFLRCKRQRIYDLLSARTLTRIKDGSRTLVSRAEIERHLERSRE